MNSRGVPDLADWELIRRYAVPERMIAECTAARESGDWAAACAAGEVDVAADLLRRFGREATAGIEQMLAGFAPDLLRWHLPRQLDGCTALVSGTTYVLAPAGPVEPGTIVLTVASPRSIQGSQRLFLNATRACDLPKPSSHKRTTPHVSRLAPHHWDARRAGDLRAWVGGSDQRVPRFTAAGDPLPAEALGIGNDVPARAERVLRAPRTAEAWAEAELEVIPAEAVNGYGAWSPLQAPFARRIDPLRLAAEARRLAASYGRTSWALRDLSYAMALRVDVDGDAVRVEAIHTWHTSTVDDLPRLDIGLLRSSPDLDLVWHGRITPQTLHPLVRAALFPAAPAAALRAPAPAEPIRVRCGSDWHIVDERNGRLTLLAHTAAEEWHELAVRTFGGTASGCFAAAQAWTGLPGRLPRRLRERRRELWLHMLHGGTQVVLGLLDAGMDPRIADSRGRTLLHQLNAFDHTLLLPRLLAGGLDPNALDQDGCTPLFYAVGNHLPPDLIAALIDAGASAGMQA